MLAYQLLLRRDFTDLAYDGIGRRVLVRAVLPLTALLAVTVAVIAGSTSASGSGIDQAKVNRSLATTFAHLYRMQTEQLHRPAVTEAQQQVDGFFQIRTSTGDVPNPLWPTATSIC